LRGFNSEPPKYAHGTYVSDSPNLTFVIYRTVFDNHLRYNWNSYNL